MSPFSLSVVLLVGSEHITVDAELGELVPPEAPQWGCLLRGVPERLAAAMRPGQKLLCFSLIRDVLCPGDDAAWSHAD